MPPTSDTRCAALTRCGRRAVNEDAVLVAALPGDAQIAAVADGMGGHAAGDVASRRALEVLREAVAAGADLADAVRTVNAAVHTEALSRHEHAGMGTTLVALLRRGARYVIANVGDSRAYRVDASGVRLITDDHSFVADAVRSGQLTAEEAGRSRWRNAVTRAIGTEPGIEVDCFGPFDAGEPHAIVLCSDGLYRTLPEDELRRVLRDDLAIDQAVSDLAGTAFDAGSNDNISVVAVRFGAAPAASAPVARAAARDDGRGNGRPAPRRRDGPNRRPDLPGRWTSMEMIVILVAVLIVLVYVGLLALVF